MCFFCKGLPYNKCALIITQNQHFCKEEVILCKGKRWAKKVHFFEHIRAVDAGRWKTCQSNRCNRSTAGECSHSPNPAGRSAELRFAVIALSKTMAVGRDHLIHRKRSPFPYEGKALTPLKVGKIAIVERNISAILRCFVFRLKTLREGERVRGSPHPPLTWSPFPSGGDR